MLLPRKCLTALLGIVVVLAADARAQQVYQKPPREIAELLDAAPTPLASLSPRCDYLLLLHQDAYPGIAEVAAPMLRLAGLRINPRTNGPQRMPRFAAFSLVGTGDGSTVAAKVVRKGKLGMPLWAPDGRHVAFTVTNPDGIALDVLDVQSPDADSSALVKSLNCTYGTPAQWLPDSRTLLVQLVPAHRGEAPAGDEVPRGPVIQQSDAKKSPVWTYQDLLRNERDEKLFQYYCTSQLALVGLDGKVTPIGKPALFEHVSPSPDGSFLLVERTVRPFSYQQPAQQFAREVEIWSTDGKLVKHLASRPLQDQVPIDGVPVGPRAHEWRSTAPATVVWAEALDGGDPEKAAPRRDRLVMLSAPFTAEAVELFQTTHRYMPSIHWLDGRSLGLVRELDRKKRWQQTHLIDADKPGEAARLLWDHSANERYKHPGNPVMQTSRSGHPVVAVDGENIFLAGPGATPKGDRPFLRKLNLSTLKTEELFRSDSNCLETVLALAAGDGSRFLTRHESPSDPANYYLRSADARGRTALTKFPDPQPALRGITRQLVAYPRDDGVQLSFTLYLPPGYKQGERLPAVVWAYPREFTDAGTAGQVSGSVQRFITVTGPSHLFFLLRGYAVLDGATMPVIGDLKTANNTYIEQIAASARAAIAKADQMGVIDPERVGVGGHSYGAFMTANLLAHTDLFRAGIARSGAYNRTLTPFGFQAERRSLWQASDIYLKMSPFMYAHRIKAPLLLIHGEVDDNPGTFPIQSERLYQAVKGNGGTVRYVVLPSEAHGYQARESIEHTLYEMITWFDQHVKNAPSRQKGTP